MMRPNLVEHVIESPVSNEIKKISVDKPLLPLKKTIKSPPKPPSVINRQINSFVLNILAVIFIGLCFFCLYYRKRHKEKNKLKHEENILLLEQGINKYKYNVSK